MPIFRHLRSCWQNSRRRAAPPTLRFVRLASSSRADARMTGFETLENDFQSFLLTGTAGIEKRIVGTARVPIATRLAIYGNAYRSRLAETLEAHYPALVALMGAADFDKLCGAYIDFHESDFPSIRYY